MILSSTGCSGLYIDQANSSLLNGMSYTPPQSSVILRSVFHLVFHFQYIVPTFGDMFIGHQQLRFIKIGTSLDWLLIRATTSIKHVVSPFF
ncbi:hypothetical protein H8K32_13140 [Undibacterium jejuense]|uniref:Uncharacterized protein n=1 Tax=Undibacterium jejuense TaxID=1344949 RepID=A0A923HHF6_9BURK|nr:hypothetical protein [Undibacterium jejuense]MBC3863050.1 hypothetical protein [Undibacterium jejuense]